MTEQEWLECADPQKMLEFLEVKASERQLRLFACACCRSLWEMLVDERSRSGLEAAEYYADGLGSLAQDSEVREGCLWAMENASGDSESADLGNTKWHAACSAVCCTEIPLRWDIARYASQEARQAELCFIFESENPGVEVPYPPKESEGSAHAVLLRDIFGNPFRPIAIKPAWLTPTVLSLAQATYDNRNLPSGTLDNARLGILADALEDTGCDNTDLLNHLRQPGEHVRGCWCVDLLLGKQ